MLPVCIIVTYRPVALQAVYVPVSTPYAPVAHNVFDTPPPVPVFPTRMSNEAELLLAVACEITFPDGGLRP